MSVIGNSPATSFKTIQKQSITGTGATAYALNYPVSSPNDLEVFVNNIRQEPIISYNASTQTITFSEAVDSTDSVYVIYQGQTMGSVLDTTAYRKAEVDAAVTTKVSKTGDTMTGALALPTGGLNVGSGQLTVDTSGRVRMQYQPAFSGTRTAGEVASGSVMVFNEVNVNIGSHYNTSNGRFTAPIDGTYEFSTFFMGALSSTDTSVSLLFRKNGSATTARAEPYTRTTGAGYVGMSGSCILSLIAGDYVDVQNVSTAPIYGVGSGHNQFTAKLIG